jgi:23S rRNA pseudouridine1911/1915/1917 synthase
VKRYLALVRGVIRRDTLVIDAAVGRHPTDRKRMSTRTRAGRPAVTRIAVLERFPGLTLVEAAPETGRTHQIRVHLAARGHPLVGDHVYGRQRTATSALLARHALHAAELTVTHPTSGERLTIRAPLWPDMADALARLRAARA